MCICVTVVNKEGLVTCCRSRSAADSPSAVSPPPLPSPTRRATPMTSLSAVLDCIPQHGLVFLTAGGLFKGFFKESQRAAFFGITSEVLHTSRSATARPRAVRPHPLPISNTSRPLAPPPALQVASLM